MFVRAITRIAAKQKLLPSTAAGGIQLADIASAPPPLLPPLLVVRRGLVCHGYSIRLSMSHVLGDAPLFL
jgi:hypothetical protein